MKDLRRWELNATKPFSLQLGADARLSRTDYTDDQVWELALGVGESPALALQTQYGGRAGLASLVPMWLHDSRTIYQAQAYAGPPIITAFAPNYLRAQARPMPTINLFAEYWAMESHAVGARFTLQNTGGQSTTIRLDLFGHVVAGDKELDLAIVSLADHTNALSLGEVGNLKPAVILENGQASLVAGEAVSPKIGVDLRIKPGEAVAVRWVHAGLKDLRDSLALAQHWLAQDWDAHFRRIAEAAQAIPRVETGRGEWDAAIAFSYQQLVQSFLKPTGNLPYSSFVATRQSWQGFSPRGDGSDHPRAWSGQTPMIAYLAASAMASIDPHLAQGVIRNCLAIQAEDGWIDLKPGLGGQREGALCMPILARLAWNVYQATGDLQFLAEVFPGLLNFFTRWFKDDLDADQDGLPEWQSERQVGYVYAPTFAASQQWGQGADIRCVESPDLAAYLLSETISLQEMARRLEKKRIAGQLDRRVAALEAALESLWNGERYTYRDRDTHATTGSVSVLEDGRGDEEHIPSLALTPPNRVIVRITGGEHGSPNIRIHLAGLDPKGHEITETAESKSFVWGYGRGVYTSQQVFSRIDRVRCEGLSRVYRIHVDTVDTTRLDISALAPLCSGGISQERADALVRMLSDEKHFLRTNGVTMCSARDSTFDPSNAKGSGGIWPFWVTLIGEGLIAYGYEKQAADSLRRLLNAQTEVLTHRKKFHEFYHSDEPQGGGERGHLAGIVPLHLLMRVLGVQIVSTGKAWAGGPFVWDKPVRVTQHGVAVERSRKGTRIVFPSGHKVTLEAGQPWQEVIDPKPVAPAAIEPLPDSPPSPKGTKRSRPKSVIIEVDDSDE